MSIVPKPLPIDPVPGVTYSPLERRAHLTGTGIDVWEIVQIFRRLNEDFALLQRSFDWLSAEQLHRGLEFASRNPAFIAAELAEVDAVPLRLQELYRDFPFTVPPLRR